ncbi:MAG: trypsin-like cysteine/serine peptidase domain-containing protein [Monoraphidium minutum]|nr:MAG: trypsin-like cysteine/serine peptidase domain-containing protein [Monoraphidium minutum]
MGRFADEGLVLAGPARLADFQVTKPARSANGGVRIASQGSGASSPLYTVRVLPKEGLVYVSALPHDANADAPAAAATPSVRPARAAVAASLAAARAAALESGDVTAAAVAGGAAAAAKKRKNLDAPGWTELQELAAHPYSAVGWLNLGYEGGSGMCSGSLIGKHTVVTAAHCVHDRGSGSSLSDATFVPHNYYTTRLVRVKPFGEIEAYAFDFLSGWATEDDIDQAWISDMAVILLKKDAGTATGTLGFAYNNSGYSGAINLAGYPGETPRIPGMFFKLKSKCVIEDKDGTDAALDMKPATQNTCLTPCSIAERGQSGQPAFIQAGGSFVVRGVLSHGPPTGECYGYDTYTEVDAMHYKFLQKHSTWTPPKN